MIYFVQTGDNRHIKIGYARDVRKRVASLQTGAPLGIKVLGVQPGDFAIEKALHARFAALRMAGEWFEAAPELVSYAVQAATLGAAGVADDDPFLRYAVREPRLISLLVEAAATRDDDPDDYFCANEVFFRYRNPRAGLKWRLSKLVGHYADTIDPVLRTSEAYDVVYERIYEALPDCRGCTCLGGYR